MTYLVYLGGPIAEFSTEQALEWRKYATDYFLPNIRVLSPLRGHVRFDPTSSNVLCTDRGITMRDRNDIMRCDLVLMNFLNATKVSIGSVGEVFWADAFRKPCVVIMDKDNIHDHPMIRDCASVVVDNFHYGLTVARAILLPEVS